MLSTNDSQGVLDPRARRLLEQSLVIDALSGHYVAPEPPPLDGRSYLDRGLDVGLNAVNITLGAHNDSFDDVLEQMFHYFSLIEHRIDRAKHVRTVADIEAARSEGKLAFIFGTQTSGFVGGDTWRWTILHQLGLRIAQLTYNERNALGDGCREPENRGLTAYGQQAVQEMNRLGICLDISHTGERTSLDAIAHSSQPAIASHANCRSVSPSQRNLSDHVLRAVADSGGVVGLTPHSAMAFKTTGVRPTLNDYLDQFDYAVDCIGADHVGIGTDLFESYTKISWESSTKRMYPNPWYWETMFSDGFAQVEDWERMVDGLLARHYSEADITKFLGANWIRVFEIVWADEQPPRMGDRGWNGVGDSIAVVAGG